jgi:hypothetical protein
MRKRLYQASPEHSELIDGAHSASLEKVKRRFYAESIGKDSLASDTGVAEYIESLAEIFTVAMYSNWNHTASTSTQFFKWYMDAGQAAWETGAAVICNAFSWRS